ncbi:hypothetical protein BpHYR1_028168, partial [Brachionus plicatilis]
PPQPPPQPQPQPQPQPPPQPHLKKLQNCWHHCIYPLPLYEPNCNKQRIIEILIRNQITELKFFIKIHTIIFLIIQIKF